MAEEYKTVKRISMTLETRHPEVAAYLGGYIDGIHNTCAWIEKINHVEEIRLDTYRWIVDLKERLNLSNASEEEIKKDFVKQIIIGLEKILSDSSEINYSLEVKELKIN